VKHWERLTAKDALDHVWVKCLAPRYRLDAFDKSFFETLCLRTRRLTVFKKVALHLVSGSLNEGHVKSLHDIFQATDKNGDGYLSFAEIAHAILNSEVDVPCGVYRLVQDLDINGEGHMSFSEFLTLAVDNSEHLTADLLWTAFNHFDLDGNGAVSLVELQTILGSPEVSLLMGQDPCSIQEMFDDVDLDQSGAINFDEFKRMMLDSALK